jgi:hypothetical protein
MHQLSMRFPAGLRRQANAARRSKHKCESEIEIIGTTRTLSMRTIDIRRVHAKKTIGAVGAIDLRRKPCALVRVVPKGRLEERPLPDHLTTA